MVVSNEPNVANNTRGMEVRECYMLSKIGLDDTFDQDDIDRYNNNMMAAEPK